MLARLLAPLALLAVLAPPAIAVTPSPPAPTVLVEPWTDLAQPGLRITGAVGDLTVERSSPGTLQLCGAVRWRVDRDRLRRAVADAITDVVVNGRAIRLTLARNVVATAVGEPERESRGERRWHLRTLIEAPEASPRAGPRFTQSDAGPSTPLPLVPEPAAGGTGPAPAASDQAAVHALATTTGAELRLTWPPGTGAAVLQRGGQVWIALSEDPGEVEIDRAAMARALAGLVVGLREPRSDRGRVLQLRLERAVGVAVRRDGDTWVVALSREAATPPQPVAVPTSASGILLAGAVGVIAAEDEATGDRLFFAPMRDAPFGLPRAARLPDADLLATAQGLAWRARSDRAAAATDIAPTGTPVLPIEVGPHAAERLAAARVANAPSDPQARTGVDQPPDPRASPGPAATTPAITTTRDGHGEAPVVASVAEPVADDGHAVDHAADSGTGPTGSAAPVPAEPVASDPAVLKVLEARGLGLASLDAASLAELRRIGQRLAAIGASESGRRTRARIAWARTLIGADRSAEAAALLELERGDADAAGLGAVADVLTDRPERGRATLLDPARDADPEIALWRLLLPSDADSPEGSWPASDELLRVLDRYPLDLRVEAARRLAERAIAAGRAELALQLRDSLARAPLSRRQQAVVAWIAGTVLGREGDIAAAREQLAIAAGSPDPAVRAAASAELVRAERAAGSITAARAADRLGEARPFWRGLPNEAALLVQLGDEAELAGRPVDALVAWREGLGKGLPAGTARRLSQRLEATFVASLERLAAEARAVPGRALEAVALIDRFPELLPAGEPGAALRAAVARTLVPAGLPRLALRLVDGSADAGAGLPPEERARWHLAAAEPDRALSALDAAARTAPPPDPARLASLRAEARLAQGDAGAALAELTGADAADEVIASIRREALWRLGDHAGFVAASAPRSQAPAAELDQLRLAAIAFARSDEAGLHDALTSPHPDAEGPAPGAFAAALAMPVPRATSVRELVPASEAAQRQARALLEAGPDPLRAPVAAGPDGAG